MNYNSGFGQEEDLFTPLQQNVLIVIPYITASLSAVASSSIIIMILKDRKRKLTMTYHRLLLCMSSVDVITSCNIAFASLLLPIEYGRFASHGTTGTCELSGFLLQLNVTMSLLTLTLCVYYLLVIVYERTPGQLQKSRFEVVAVSAAFLYPLTVGVVALALDSYNPMLSLPGWCYISEFPYECNAYDDVECIRGEDYFYVNLVGGGLPVFVSMVGGIVCMILIHRKVRIYESTLQRSYSFADRSGRRRFSVTTGERTRQTAIQAALYTGAFLLTYAVPISHTITGAFMANSAVNRTYFFVTGILVVVFAPLQGLWNFIIYVRPKITSVRKRHPDYSWFDAFQVAVLGKVRFVSRVASSSPGGRNETSTGNWMADSNDLNGMETGELAPPDLAADIPADEPPHEVTSKSSFMDSELDACRDDFPDDADTAEEEQKD